MKAISAALLVAALLTAGGLTACGGDDAPAAPPTIAAADPATAFAPLVELSAGERWYPVSADYFLAQSGLEWGGGPCSFERDISASASSRALAGEELPDLDPDRLGREPAYRFRPLQDDCITKRDGIYTSTEHTRPYDFEDRPVGLHADEGFYLDILSDAQAGRRRVGADGSLVGVPTYYAVDRMPIDGQAGVRISYWLLFGRGGIPQAGGTMGYREGDWERIDVLTQLGSKRGSYVPIAVRYYDVGEPRRSVAWDDADRTGPGGTHPIVRTAAMTHTPQRADGSCDHCTPWRTWTRLRDVRDERWFGFGGGWGSVGKSDEESGPAGPSPFVLGPSP